MLPETLQSLKLSLAHHESPEAAFVLPFWPSQLTSLDIRSVGNVFPDLALPVATLPATLTTLTWCGVPRLYGPLREYGPHLVLKTALFPSIPPPRNNYLLDWDWLTIWTYLGKPPIEHLVPVAFTGRIVPSYITDFSWGTVYDRTETILSSVKLPSVLWTFAPDLSDLPATLSKLDLLPVQLPSRVVLSVDHAIPTLPLQLPPALTSLSCEMRLVLEADGPKSIPEDLITALSSSTLKHLKLVLHPRCPTTLGPIFPSSLEELELVGQPVGSNTLALSPHLPPSLTKLNLVRITLYPLQPRQILPALTSLSCGVPLVALGVSDEFAALCASPALKHLKLMFYRVPTPIESIYSPNLQELELELQQGRANIDFGPKLPPSLTKLSLIGLVPDPPLNSATWTYLAASAPSQQTPDTRYGGRSRAAKVWVVHKQASISTSSNTPPKSFFASSPSSTSAAPVPFQQTGTFGFSVPANSFASAKASSSVFGQASSSNQASFTPNSSMFGQSPPTQPSINPFASTQSSTSAFAPSAPSTRAAKAKPSIRLPPSAKK